jgi:predicted ATPase
VPDAVIDDLGEHALKDFGAPRSIYHLVVEGRHSSAFAPPRTLEAARTNLPSAAGPLLGREDELAELRAKLAEGPHRIVTIVGLGGTGKTRLALACGAELLDAFADGVFLVGLAPVSSPAGVPAAMAEALAAPRMGDLGPEGAVLEFLRGRHALLVLDNCEHVLDAAPFIGRVLEAAPGVRVLATSQAPLRLSAETVIALEALALPAADESDLEVVAGVPSVRLFAERARAADSTFSLTAANAGAVAQLCRRLEGLPLALELAAARVRLGGVDGLLRALDRGPDALGRGARDLPERQRGIRAALEFTVSLLSEEERNLFGGLGVFADAWTLEQAEDIFGEDLDTWEAMASLIDFSLIQTRGDGRLTMAERVRRHARELLSRSGDERRLRTRHAELMAKVVEELAREQLLDINGVIARTQDQLADVELALSWVRTHDAELHRRIIAAAARPFYFVARLGSIAAEIERLRAADDRDDISSGQLLVGMGMVRCLQGDMAGAAEFTEAAVACHRRTGPPAELLNSLAINGHMLTLANRGEDSRRCLNEALELAAADDADPRLRDQLEGTLAFAAVVEGRYEEAARRLQDVMARPERTDFAAKAAPSYWADTALGQGDYGTALARFASALRDLRDYDLNNSVLQMIGMAAALAGLGSDERAAQLEGAIQSASREIGMADEVLSDQEMYAAPLRAAAERLGEQRWEQLRNDGRRMNLVAAVKWALEVAETPIGA